MFFGLFLVLLGISVIVNYAFGLHFPLFRILVGLFVIYLGVKIIFGSSYSIDSKHWARKDKGSVAFTQGSYSPENEDEIEREYNAVFGSLTIDLTRVQKIEKPLRIEVNAVFGEAVVIIPKGTSLETKLNSVAGQIVIPDQGDSGEKGKLKLELEANAVFGRISVRN